MRGLEDESIDLIYLDPPFNSKHDYAAPIGSKASGAAFKDTWTLDDVNISWWGEIAESYPALYKVLEATRETGGKSMMSYLIYMAVRIMEMHRILKKTGSLYLHCDPTASHYLKLGLDAVFGKTGFKSEISWRRTDNHNAARRYGRVHVICVGFEFPRAKENHGFTAKSVPRRATGAPKTGTGPLARRIGYRLRPNPGPARALPRPSGLAGAGRRYLNLRACALRSSVFHLSPCTTMPAASAGVLRPRPECSWKKL